MITVTLTRLEMSDAGTFGVVDFKGLQLVSGELPFQNNEQGVSCVPEGEYKAVWAFSPRFQLYTYLLKDVPARSAIRIHVANFVGRKGMRGIRSQVDGCIALGEDVRFVDKQQMLYNSSDAVQQFNHRMGGESFMMVIQSDWR